ncbi:MAG TPA: FtsX-like permease family protein [Candidatus Angelobacter sp.]|jgi:putative ABC transport system permease protein|nr:FtsX-like permease family protein [Candidatus Angelobacter sp.]
MLKATLRGLLAHKLRLALATMAIVLGVSFVTGTLVIGDTINSTFDTLFKTTTAGVDVDVRAVSTGTEQGHDVHPPIPVSVLPPVQAVNGVKEAFPYLARVAVIVGKDGKVVSTGGAPTLGLLWNPYPDMSSFRLRSGAPPQGPDQVVIDAHTASVQGFKAGDSVRIVLPSGSPQTFTLSGTTGFGNQDNLAGATVAAFDPQAGRALLGAPNEYDGIYLKAQQGVSPETLKARVAAVLPHGVEAVTGQTLAQEQTDAVKTGIGFLTTFLLVFAFISLFVGSFIILNTFAILVAQRTRELALLRCLGATRGQVMRSVLTEAAITGLVAAILGILAGLGIAKGLEALLGAVGLDLSGTSLQLQPHTVIAGLAVGVLVTIVASVLPARRATRVAPVEALRDAMPSPSVVSAGRIIGGLLLLGAGVLSILLGLFALPSNQLLVTGLGALATFIGVAVLAPIVVGPVVSVLGAPVRRFRGVPGKLARENAMRQPRRTASTASALMIGVGLVSCFTVVAASLTGSINRIVDRTVNADYIISPQTQGNGDALLSPDITTRLAADRNVAVVSPISGGTFHYGNEADQVEAVDTATILRVADVTVQNGASLDRLGDGQVAISEDAAKNHALKVGDVVPMQLPRPGVLEQRVATVYARNPLLGDYLVTRSTWQRGSIEIFDFVVLVKGSSGVSQSALRSSITSDLSAFPNVQVQNNAEYKKTQGQQIDVLLNLLTALVVLAIVIALLGVVNTMALAIVERVRELGLVRALGMTRSQTRSMVRWETVLITVFGALLGCVVGLFFGVALVRAFASQGVDVLDLALGRQVQYVLVAFVAGLVAAIWPARRAARVDLLQAIATE